MKNKILFATLLTLALFTAGYAQTRDNANLDQFFDRLAEKNKAMGSLTITKDGNVIYIRGIVFEFDAAKNQMTIKRGGGEKIFTKEK